MVDATLRLLASPGHRDGAVSTLLQLARVDSAAVASVVDDGGWAGALVEVLGTHSGSRLARPVVVLMLALLFSRIELRDAFGEAGLADLTRRMLLRPGATGADQEVALLLLMGIARGEVECVMAVALGAAPLVRLLPVHPIALAVLHRACGALTASTARGLTREGAVACLTAMSQVGADTADTAAYASAVLCQLAKRCGDASCAPSTGRARAYVLALSAGSAKEREQVALAMFAMSAQGGESAVALVWAGCAGALAELLFTGGASAQVHAAMSLLAVSWASAEGAVAVAQTIGSQQLRHGARSALASVILNAMSPVGQAELGCADVGALFAEEFARHMGAGPNPDGDAESAVDGLHAILAFLIYLHRSLCREKAAVFNSLAVPAAGGVWAAVVNGVATGASRLGAAAMESRGAKVVQLLHTGTPAERAAALGLFNTLAHTEGEAVQRQMQLACAPLLALVQANGPGGPNPHAAHTLASLLQRDTAGTLATAVVEAGCVDSVVRALFEKVVGVHSLAQEWALEAMVGLASRGGHRAACTAVNVAGWLGGAKGVGAARKLAALAAEGLRVAARARPRNVEPWRPVERGDAHESEARRCMRAAREAAATLACDAAEARRARPAARARCRAWTPAPRCSPPPRRRADAGVANTDPTRDREARIRVAWGHSRQLALDDEARVGVEMQRWELRRLGNDIAHGRG